MGSTFKRIDSIVIMYDLQKNTIIYLKRFLNGKNWKPVCFYKNVCSSGPNFIYMPEILEKPKRAFDKRGLQFVQKYLRGYGMCSYAAKSGGYCKIKTSGKKNFWKKKRFGERSLAYVCTTQTSKCIN